MKYFPYEEIFRKNHYTGVKGEDSAQAARVAVAASAVVGVEGIAGRVEVFLLLILLVALLVVFHPLAIALVGLRLVLLYGLRLHHVDSRGKEVPALRLVPVLLDVHRLGIVIDEVRLPQRVVITQIGRAHV